MTSRTLVPKALTLCLVALALAAPAALAVPMTNAERQAIAARGVGAPTPSPVVVEPQAPRPQVSHDDGFDFGAAAIGAGFAGVLVALGGLGLVRRQRVRFAP